MTQGGTLCIHLYGERLLRVDFYLFLKTTPATSLPLVASSALADATGQAGTTTQVSNAIVKAGPSLCAVDARRMLH
jgi:hypothetical protein